MIITKKEELQKECKEVSIFEASQIIVQLENELANSSGGIGLAANQIGIDARVCIIRAKNKLDLINPVIEETYDLMEFDNEGCLSFPDQWITTKRFNEILVKDMLHPAGVVLTGLDAVVVQHEVGHLYGEIMYDYQITRPGPNLPCWCGSGKKYKRCHNGKVIQGA